MNNYITITPLSFDATAQRDCECLRDIGEWKFAKR